MGGVGGGNLIIPFTSPLGDFTWAVLTNRNDTTEAGKREVGGRGPLAFEEGKPSLWSPRRPGSGVVGSGYPEPVNTPGLGSTGSETGG